MTVLHELLQRESFPQAAVLHELLQPGSFPRGAVFQEQTAPVWLCHRITGPARKPAPVWAPHGFTASLRGLPAPTWSPARAAGGDPLHHGPPWAAGTQPAPPWSTPWAAEEPLLQCLEHLLPPPSLTLVYAELFLSHILTPLSSCSCCCAAAFFPLLNYVIPEALPLSLMALALASNGSVLEPAGISSV